MILVRPRRIFAAVVLSALALAGCAVPGEGRPGVAATYGDRVVTAADVDRIYGALDDLYSRPHPGEDLTLLLIGPGALEIAKDNGYVPTDATLREDALLWMAAQQGDAVEPSPAVIEVVGYVRAIAFDMHDADGLIALVELAQDVEANTIASPRYGVFTFDNFSTSINDISTYLTTASTGLGPAVFLAYKDVDGFAAQTLPEWISSE